MAKVISRKEAKAKGLKVYFTGKPCVNGHISERRVCNCECIACERVRKGLAEPKAVKKKEAPKKIVVRLGYDEARTVRVVKFAPRVSKSFYKAYDPVILSDERVVAHA